jgi:hypothetical protein
MQIPGGIFAKSWAGLWAGLFSEKLENVSGAQFLFSGDFNAVAHPSPPVAGLPIRRRLGLD